MRIRLRKAPAVLLLAAALLPVHAGPSSAHNNTGAAIAAGVVGLAVGAAIAGAASRPRAVYGPPPAPVYAPPPPFSPAANVVCYPGQRACYYNGGAYSADWTYRVYGR